MDTSWLRGASIRSPLGASGRLVAVKEGRVSLGWDDPDSLLPREEDRSLGDLSELEVLTLDLGWVPLDAFVEEDAYERPRVRSIASLVADLRDVLPEVTVEGGARSPRLQEGVEVLLETAGGKPHSPFKTAAKTFIGPRNGWFHRFPGHKKGKHLNRHHKKDVWDCSSEGPYKQICVAQKDVPEQGVKKGQQKTVTQPAASKSKYNKEYKAFVAASGEKASRSKLLRRIKMKKKAKEKAKAAKAAAKASE
jgi:hypothetical protein